MDISAWIAATSAVAALIALAFTALQVRYAGRQTALQERMQQDAAQPFVWVDFRPSDRNGILFGVVVKNEGPTVATDVVITFDPPLAARYSGGLGAEVRLASMPPGRQITWEFDSGLTLYDDPSVATRYNVTVTAAGPFGRTAPLTYVLDLADYLHSAVSPSGTLHGVTQQLKDLTAQLKKGASVRTGSRPRNG